MAQAAAEQHHHADAHGHAHAAHHPPTATYVQIAVVLFALTALEVGAFEIAERQGGFVGEHVTAILVLLSAVKFALVAFFYMHLKMDGSMLRRIFGFSLVIATIVIMALSVLFAYEASFSSRIVGKLAGT